MKSKTTKRTAKKSPKKATQTKKTTVAKTTKTKTKAVAKPAKKPETKGNFVLRRNGNDAEGNAQFSAIKVYNKKPSGWKENKTSTGAPAGYRLVHNGKTVSSGQRRVGLIKAGK